MAAIRIQFLNYVHILVKKSKTKSGLRRKVGFIATVSIMPDLQLEYLKFLKNWLEGSANFAFSATRLDSDLLGLAANNFVRKWING